MSHHKSKAIILSRFSRNIFGLILAVTLLTPATAAENRLDVATEWVDVANRAALDAKLDNLEFSRASAILHTCIYDAWVAYDEKAVGTQLGGALRRPASERTAAVVRYAKS